MHWHFPPAFLLLIAWLILALYYFLAGRKKRSSLSLSSLAGVKLKPGLRTRLAEAPACLFLLALLALIVALARPQKPYSSVLRNAEGIDIMLVLDISDSMLIEDMSPGNRLLAAKTVIKKFIQGLVYDRAGLIVFSGESYTRVPLTLDYQAFLQDLKQVQTSHYIPYIKKGTAIGVALANAAARLKVSSAKSKVVVFLTDGEDNVGVINPQTALNIVKQLQVKVYTIGVGKSGWTRIPRQMRDSAGRIRTIYQPINSTINEKLLQQIAGETGGKYFKADNAKALKLIFDEIGRLEKSKVEEIKQVQYEELFPVFLRWAGFLSLLAFVLYITVFWRVF